MNAHTTKARDMIAERVSLEGEIAQLELRWALLQPAIENSLGGARGSGDLILEGRPDAGDYHVLTKIESEVLDYHLRELGELIDKIAGINRGRA